jgi:hypothetical protein
LLVGDAEAGSAGNAGVGRSILDRTRRLIALDRALIEIGEPGVLEREPSELARLEAQLFGDATAADAGIDDPPYEATATSDAAPPHRRGLPDIRVIDGQRQDHVPADDPERIAQRQALRAQLQVIPGGLLEG